MKYEITVFIIYHITYFSQKSCLYECSFEQEHANLILSKKTEMTFSPAMFCPTDSLTKWYPSCQHRLAKLHRFCVQPVTFLLCVPETTALQMIVG